jgi:hypothetical protein
MEKKHWYNNGVIEIQKFSNEIIPDGFVRGRLPFTKEAKEHMSKSMLGQYRRKNNPYHSEEDKKKISESLKKRYSETCHPSKGKHPWNYGLVGAQEAWNKGLKYSLSDESKISMVEKRFESQKKNGTLGINQDTRVEVEYFQYLLTLFDKDDIIHPYFDRERYPYKCDFYIKSEDKFIEVHGNWTHGGRPFDPNDEDCQKQLAIWQEKAKTSKFYENAIYTWTILDVKKLEIARKNNLNFEAIYP